jgi:hypothetical protein
MDYFCYVSRRLYRNWLGGADVIYLGTSPYGEVWNVKRSWCSLIFPINCRIAPSRVNLNNFTVRKGHLIEVIRILCDIWIVTESNKNFVVLIQVLYVAEESNVGHI